MINSQQKKSPNLRFQEFVNEWDSKPLSFLAFKVKKKNIDNAESYVLTNSATRGIVGQKDYFDKEIANSKNLSGYYVVQKDDFVYNPRISANAPVGPIKRNKHLKGIMSPLYSIFRFSDSNLDYCEHFFDSSHWYHYMKSVANYGARFDRMNITNKDFFNLPLPNPCTEEQQKIASFLSSIDIKIKQLGKKKSLLGRYKKGIMQKLFSQELRFKDTQGNDYPDWEEKPFGKFAKKITDSYNPLTSDEEWESIELESLGQDSGKVLTTFRAKNLQSIKTKFLKGDVLFGKLRPYLRKYTHAKFNGVCTSEIWVLRADGLSDSFLYFIIQSSRFNQYANIQSGSKMPRSDWKIVSSSRFAVPSLKEQQKIANFLSAIDQKIELVTTELELARTFKKGLLQQMFV